MATRATGQAAAAWRDYSPRSQLPPSTHQNHNRARDRDPGARGKARQEAMARRWPTILTEEHFAPMNVDTEVKVLEGSAQRASRALNALHVGGLLGEGGPGHRHCRSEHDGVRRVALTRCNADLVRRDFHVLMSDARAFCLWYFAVWCGTCVCVCCVCRLVLMWW